jgi:stringent starvation protein B
MTSSRAYIMRALYEWILDNDCTPYVLVNALGEDVAVPQQYVKDGQIILNISPTAVSELSIHNDAVFFNGRFGGIATDVHVPIASVIGIYARENGQGMVFDHEESPLPEPPPGPPPPASPIKGPHKPSLKVVK